MRWRDVENDLSQLPCEAFQLQEKYCRSYGEKKVHDVCTLSSLSPLSSLSSLSSHLSRDAISLMTRIRQAPSRHESAANSRLSCALPKNAHSSSSLLKQVSISDDLCRMRPKVTTAFTKSILSSIFALKTDLSGDVKSRLVPETQIWGSRDRSDERGDWNPPSPVLAIA